MPFLQALITSKSGEKLTSAVANELNSLTQSLLHKDPALTSVLVTEADTEDWFIDGKSLASHRLSSFALDIKITAGTNTKAEMANYIGAVFAAMRKLLGPLHDASYVLVHELAAQAWGYEGKTQEFRFISGRLSASP